VLNQIKVQGMTVCGAGLPPSLDFAQEASIQSALSEFRSGEKQLLLHRLALFRASRGEHVRQLFDAVETVYLRTATQ
jgi:hypothetical protein